MDDPARVFPQGRPGPGRQDHQGAAHRLRTSCRQCSVGKNQGKILGKYFYCVLARIRYGVPIGQGESAGPLRTSAMSNGIKYLVATVTGADSVDASGRSTGPEIARVYSRHGTLRAAHRSQKKYCGLASCPVILTADGQRLSQADRVELFAMQAGY